MNSQSQSQSQRTIDFYIRQWLAFLAYGDDATQTASMYGLRAVGWQCEGEGYWEDFLWKVRPSDEHCWCIIDPMHKALHQDRSS